MSLSVWVLGEALMDCLAQPNGQLLPLQGGSPYNMVRATALRGANAHYLNRLSSDLFGQGLRQRLLQDGVQLALPDSPCPTALAVVQVQQGQPHYGFYREGVADRDYQPQDIIQVLATQTPGILHTGSLLLIPPEHDKVLTVLRAARALGWRISVDINLRPKVAPDLQAYLQAVRLVMAECDWLKASDEDLSTLGLGDVRLQQAPALIAALRQQVGPGRLSRVALTFGEHGACLDIEGHSASARAPQVQVQDTVGAGDTFWGNTLADWALQPSDCAQRLPTTLQWAMTAAAINCTRQGCQPPSAAQTQAFLREVA